MDGWMNGWMDGFKETIKTPNGDKSVMQPA